MLKHVFFTCFGRHCFGKMPLVHDVFMRFFCNVFVAARWGGRTWCPGCSAASPAVTFSARPSSIWEQVCIERRAAAAWRRQCFPTVVGGRGGEGWVSQSRRLTRIISLLFIVSFWTHAFYYMSCSRIAKQVNYNQPKKSWLSLRWVQNGWSDCFGAGCLSVVGAVRRKHTAAAQQHIRFISRCYRAGCGAIKSRDV